MEVVPPPSLLGMLLGTPPTVGGSGVTKGKGLVGSGGAALLEEREEARP